MRQPPPEARLAAMDALAEIFEARYPGRRIRWADETEYHRLRAKADARHRARLLEAERVEADSAAVTRRTREDERRQLLALALDAAVAVVADGDPELAERLRLFLTRSGAGEKRVLGGGLLEAE